MAKQDIQKSRTNLEILKQSVFCFMTVLRYLNIGRAVK